MKIRPAKFFKKLGPGIITGAADDDPSGIATYSQAGAKYGTATLWTSLYILPLVYAVQEMSARIGLVTGKGIAKNLKEHYPRWLLYLIVSLLVIASTLNLGADLGAIAAAIQLVIPLHFDVILLSVTALIITLELFTSYKQYAKVLKWLSLSLFAYIITGVFIKTDWVETLRATVIPHISLTYEYLFLFVGLMGTTISPYVMFWQANEEVEEEMDKRLLKRTGGIPTISTRLIGRMRFDTFVGMFFSTITAWFIIFTAAHTLFPNGITNIDTAAQAAQALEPLVQSFPYSGFLTKILFALGIVGTGLLAVPIFAASSAYALSETFGWKEGLNYKIKRAKPFYLIIALSTAIGLAINYVGINPIQALIYSAVLNGITSVPLIAILLALSNNKAIMKEHTSPRLINLLGVVALIAMAIGAGSILLSFAF